MTSSIRSFRRALGMARIATLALVRGTGRQSNRNQHGDRPRERSVRRTCYCRFSAIHRNLTRPLNYRPNGSGGCRKTSSI
jgi:hypothetical protein